MTRPIKPAAVLVLLLASCAVPATKENIDWCEKACASFGGLEFVGHAGKGCPQVFQCHCAQAKVCRRGDL
jgi:hypothetical protein